MHRASIIVVCALLGACANGLPEMRPASSGFFGSGAVLNPLETGKLELAAGRNGLAIRRFGEELGRNPRSLAALNGIAIAYARLGRHDVAHTYFERALEVDARDVATLNNYGRALVDQGRLRAARPFLQQALRYADEDDVPVIAGNMLAIRHVLPPPVLEALRDQDEVPTGPRLVRVAIDRVRLQGGSPPADPVPSASDSAPDEWGAAPTEAITVVELPEPAPAPAEEQPPRVARQLEPPMPRLKPTPPLPIFKVGAQAIAPAAGPDEGETDMAAAAADPMPPDELTSIRAEIPQRITGSRFAPLLEGILTPPASDSGPLPSEEGIWT